MFIKLLALLFIVSCVFAGSVDKEFYLRPNGAQEEEVSISLGDKTCIFTHKSTGGTGEQWKLTLTDEEGPLTCYVGRPKPPSYLLFQKFSARIQNVAIGEAEVWDNSGVTLLNDQFVIENDTVKPAKNWGGNLALVVVRASK